MSADIPSGFGGENALIRRIRERFSDPRIPLGIGDDAAIVEIPPGYSIVYCSDVVVENTHFIRELHPPDSVGYKAVAVNVSDVGAMGGVPMFFTLSLAMPAGVGVKWVDAFLDGVERACADFEVNLVGGDSSSAERIFVDVSMIGRVEKGMEVRRSGAKPGDGIYVTGSLGGSALGLARLRAAGDLSDDAVQRHLYPSPRHKLGAVIAAQAHAMIDISDGLSTDLMHILEESNVSARVYRQLIPGWKKAADDHILHGGEEYELLITADSLPVGIDGVPVTRIGEIIAAGLDRQIFLIDQSSESVLQPRGFEHFL